MRNPIGLFNNLAIDGDTLYVAYSSAGMTSGLPTSGGIVAIPLSGGTPRAIVAADVASSSEWLTDSFWASGGQIYFQTGGTLGSVPAAPTTPSSLTVVPSYGPHTAYAHDAEFGYFAIGGVPGNDAYQGTVFVGKSRSMAPLPRPSSIMSRCRTGSWVAWPMPATPCCCS